MDLAAVGQVFEDEGNLVEPDSGESLVFVGDTHGDLDASQRVFDRFLENDKILVFLGDYVDRGKHSRKNINLLLQKKLEHPGKLYLLQGNHEGYKYQPFSPVDFWEGLNREDSKRYADLLGKMPLAFSHRHIFACHGGLPNVEGIDEIENIEPGDENWKKITWGDFTSQPGYGKSGLGRPQLGKDYFDLVMDKLGKTLMIRSHQPHAPLISYEDRCVTIFTSSAYGTARRVVIAPSDAESAHDLSIESLD